MQTTKVTEVILLPAQFDEKRFKEGCRLVLQMIQKQPLLNLGRRQEHD